MGKIYAKLRAKYKGKSHIFKAIVDSGADSTVIDFNTACHLGLDVDNVRIGQRSGLGGVVIKGYEMDGITIEAAGRHATLDNVFVAKMEERGRGKKKVMKPVKNDEALLGHDFLQKAGAIVDFDTHELRGLGEPVSIHELFRPTWTRRPGTEADRKQLLMFGRCPIPKKKAGSRRRVR